MILFDSYKPEEMTEKAGSSLTSQSVEGRTPRALSCWDHTGAMRRQHRVVFQENERNLQDCDVRKAEMLPTNNVVYFEAMVKARREIE